MSDGAGPVRHLTPDGIDAIRNEITPVNLIPVKRHMRTLFPPEPRRCDYHLSVYRKDDKR